MNWNNKHRFAEDVDVFGVTLHTLIALLETGSRSEHAWGTRIDIILCGEKVRVVYMYLVSRRVVICAGAGQPISVLSYELAVMRCYIHEPHEELHDAVVYI